MCSCVTVKIAPPMLFPAYEYLRHFLLSLVFFFLLLLLLQNELQELEGVPGLVILPIPAHHRHLCPGAVGKIHLQLHPLLCHRHGRLHLIRLRTHSRAPGAGVFLRHLWRPAGEHHGTHDLKETKQNMKVKRQKMCGWAWICHHIFL